MRPFLVCHICTVYPGLKLSCFEFWPPICIRAARQQIRGATSNYLMCTRTVAAPISTNGTLGFYPGFYVSDLVFTAGPGIHWSRCFRMLVSSIPLFVFCVPSSTFVFKTWTLLHGFPFFDFFFSAWTFLRVLFFFSFLVLFLFFAFYYFFLCSALKPWALCKTNASLFSLVLSYFMFVRFLVCFCQRWWRWREWSKRARRSWNPWESEWNITCCTVP